MHATAGSTDSTRNSRAGRLSSAKAPAEANSGSASSRSSRAVARLLRGIGCKIGMALFGCTEGRLGETRCKGLGEAGGEASTGKWAV